ncbi:MAG TPA: helicase-associated domain-containing protein, partial [Ilumatobacteraceae bacterium]
GRVLLTDPSALDAMMPETAVEFVVQADHSVIAPPSLDPAIRGRLETLAVSTSVGSVAVYRLDSARIARALAGGENAAALIDFLAAHCSVPLPPAAAQLILDTERERGQLTVAAAATVVTASDVVGLAAAVKVKAAALTMLSPTVAISALSPAKVATALRARGLAPAITGTTVATGTVQPIRRPLARPQRPPTRAKPLLAGPEAIAAVVAEST